MFLSYNICRVHLLSVFHLINLAKRHVNSNSALPPALLPPSLPSSIHNLPLTTVHSHSNSDCDFSLHNHPHSCPLFLPSPIVIFEVKNSKKTALKIVGHLWSFSQKQWTVKQLIINRNTYSHKNKNIVNKLCWFMP